MRRPNDLIRKFIKSGQRIFVQGAAATPQVLLKNLVEESSHFQDIELIHLHTEGTPTYAEERFRQNFRVANLFLGSHMRSKMDRDRVDYLPCFLSEIPSLFRSGRRPLDVALLHLSPPDRHGFCTLGTSVDIARAAFDTAPIAIAQINSQMPRIHGDGFIHVDDLDGYVEVDEPLPQTHAHASSPEEDAIGRHVASLIEDGSCLQVGIGSIPDAVLTALKDHRHLGIHSEMWSDGVLALLQKGAIDNSQKSVHPGKCVSGFILGTKAVYDFAHDNPSVIQVGADYVNSPAIISRNRKVVAINSAVEVDLTGQVCADSIGSKIISGVGGQMDFMRGASLSPGGKPIIAMTSRTKHGFPRIVPTLKTGAGVVTTRAHVHYIVTEFGIADLFGKTLGERAGSLIQIAHPEDRDMLKKAVAGLA